MYIRFVVDRLDQDSERKLGIFHAASELRDGGELAPHELDHLQDIRDWFNTHLERPERFSRSKPTSAFGKKRGISWFKPSAIKHIAKVREMTTLLENHGVVVLVLKTDRVGYITYEDDHQVVAEPFSELVC